MALDYIYPQKNEENKLPYTIVLSSMQCRTLCINHIHKLLDKPLDEQINL